MVVDEQAEPQHPGRPHAGLMRQHEAHRPDQVRRHPQQDLALGQRLAHEAEPAVLEIAQAAVDELGGGGRGAGGEIVLLDQEDAQAAAGGVAGDARAVDAAADDGEVEIGHALIPRFASMARQRSPLKPASTGTNLKGLLHRL